MSHEALTAVLINHLNIGQYYYKALFNGFEGDQIEILQFITC